MEKNPLISRYGRELEAGETVFKEGDSGDRMYIIQEGTMQVLKRFGKEESLLAELEKGDFFGEMALVSRIERTATVKAKVKSVLLEFDRQGFQGMIEKNAKIALNVIDKLCRRLQNANQQLASLSSGNDGKKLLLNLYWTFQDSEGESLGLQEILSQGMTDQAIPQNRVEEVLEQLTQEKILTETADGKYAIQDLKAFRQKVK
jgi:CRP/FNR family cyclic AMP-dependent transcriptional regulator